MPLTKEMYEQIKHLSEPYPKCVKEAYLVPNTQQVKHRPTRFNTRIAYD